MCDEFVCDLKSMSKGELLEVLTGEVSRESGRSGKIQRKCSTKEAMEELIRRNYEWVTRMCLLEIRDSSLALDCVQDVMLQLVSSIDRFKGNSEFRTWLFVIVKRTARKFRSREQMRQWRFPTQSSEEVEHMRLEWDLSDRGEDLESAYAKSERSRMILALVRKLPEAQRHAVLLHYYEDLGVEETARRMDCSVGTVKTSLFRARRKLGVLIKKKGQQIETLLEEVR